jgi:hypothetical protein
MEAAWDLGLKCMYLPTAVKYLAMPTAIQRSEMQGSAGYGPLHDWAMNLGLAVRGREKPTSTGWMQLTKILDPEIAKTLRINQMNGLFLLPDNVDTESTYGFEDPKPPSSSKIQGRRLARPLARKEYAIALTIDSIANVGDDGTFDAVFYLQLRCCMGDKGKATRTEKPQMPYLEWKNLCGELKTPAGKSFEDAWYDKVEKAWDEEHDCRTPKWVDKDFMFRTHLAGKFKMSDATAIENFPFDFNVSHTVPLHGIVRAWLWSNVPGNGIDICPPVPIATLCLARLLRFGLLQAFSIDLTTEEPQIVIFHWLRETPGKMNNRALDLCNWVRRYESNRCLSVRALRRCLRMHASDHALGFLLPANDPPFVPPVPADWNHSK